MAWADHALGGIGCPDLFEMTAGDGTPHWALGASMDAYSVSLPMTYAYWMCAWNGTAFLADDLTPQCGVCGERLDRGAEPAVPASRLVLEPRWCLLVVHRRRPGGFTGIMTRDFGSRA